MAQWINRLPKWLILELVVPLTLLNGWLLVQALQMLQPLISILITATLLSFLLDNLVQFLQKQGVPRGSAILTIVLGVLSIVTALGVILIPLLVTQLNELAHNLPSWIESVDQQFVELDVWLDAQRIPLDLSAIATQLANAIPDDLKVLPNTLLDVVVGTADRLIDVGLTLALTIYLLLHGDAFWKGVLQWLPDGWGDRLQDALSEQFRNYFIGQATIASLMALVLTLLFLLLRIPFWLVFGLGIGIMVVIPFGDLLGMVVASTLVSLKSVWLGGEVLAIALVTDQIIDQAVAPRILSNFVGLNPIWVILSLFMGAKVGGVLGLVIAVPLAASINQLSGELKESLRELETFEG